MAQVYGLPPYYSVISSHYVLPGLLRQAALAATKKQFAGLAHTGLVMKMTQAALGRIAAPDFDINTVPHGEDPSLIPEVRPP